MRHSQYNRMRVPRIFYCPESHRGCFPLWRLRTLCFDLDCATIEKKEAAESAGRKTMGKKLRLLFIGNSHTYCNDMPLMAAKKARAAGYDCEVTMIAHGGWFLAQHVEEPDVRPQSRSSRTSVQQEIIFLIQRNQEKPILQGLQRLWEVVRCAGISMECNTYATSMQQIYQ